MTPTLPGIAADEYLPLEERERHLLHEEAPHELLHTLRSSAIATKLPGDVLERL